MVAMRPGVCVRCRSILLGSRGFDVPKLSHKLESLNAAKTLDPIEPVWEADIQVCVCVCVCVRACKVVTSN